MKLRFVKFGQRTTLLLATFFMLVSTAGALSPGDIAFVQYNADGTDNFAFVCLVDIPGSEVIYFTDNEENDLSGGEGTITWTAPVSGVACGTVVLITTSPSASHGSVSETNDLNFSSSGDALLAYQGSAGSPSYIAALSNDGGTWGGSNDGNLPAGLTDGVNALAINPEADNAAYNATVLNDSQTNLLLSINNNANWNTNNTSQETFSGTFTVTSCGAASCDITNSGQANIGCNNNGTTNDPADDYITFDLDPTGNMLGSTYSVSVSGGGASTITPNTGISYGSTTSFSLNTGTAGAGDVTLAITDDLDGTCTLVETISDPGSCAVCGITGLDTEMILCNTSTSGSNNDGVDIEIPYFGMESTAIVTNSNGVIGGDDPTTTADGTMVITGLSEGDSWNLTITGGACNFTSSGSVPGQECDPAPQILITEVADPIDNANRWVEICNRGAGSVDISGWQLRRYANGSTSSTNATVPGSITLIPGDCFVFEGTSSTIDLSDCVGSTSSSAITGNGDDVYELYDGSMPVDIYGIIGVDGTGEVWEYEDDIATRNAGVTTPTTSFDISEWTITTNVTSSSGTPCIDGTPAGSPEIQIEEPAGVDQDCGVYLYDFGQVETSNTATVTITIANEGTADLNISSASLDNITEYSITTAPASVVSAGGSTTIEVEFAPTSTNTYGATLTIVSDDSDESSCTVSFTGQGIPPTCTPSHSISSVGPTEGPEGTEILIIGSGFSGSTTVLFGSTAGTVSYVSPTSDTMIVVVPSGAESGVITVTESGCDLDAGVNFVFYDDNGLCGSTVPPGFSDILISGVYDDPSGSCHYIELFNPTGSNIDLTGYEIRLDNNFNIGDPIPATFNGGQFALSGTIQTYSTFMVRLSGTGSPCNSCGTIVPDNSFNNGGFNTQDRVYLYNGSVHTDVWQNHTGSGGYSSTGYVFTRNTSANAPTLTFNIADWASSGTENCFGFSISSTPPPTVSTLSDVSDCTGINLSVTAVAGNGGSLAYQWYYNDGFSAGWTAVSGSSPAGFTISGATSNSLSISDGASTLDMLDGYQFYVEVVEDAICAVVSNAVQFTYPALYRYYRSKASGPWRDASNWQMSPDGSSSWVDACTYPDAYNSDEIRILSGHTLSETDDADALANITIDNFVIESGGTFDVARTAEISLVDGAGTDMTVEGTLIDRGTSGAGFNDFLGTWLMGVNGTIRKTGRSSVNNFRDNYEGGIANIPSTASWYNHYDGTDTDVAVSAVGMYYPNLYLVSSSGNYNAGSFNRAFRGGSSGGYLTIKGNLEIGTSESGTVQAYYNNMFSGSPMVILGDLIIQSGSSLTNETYDVANPCTSSRGDGTGVELHGDATVNGSLDVLNYNSSDIDCGTHRRLLAFRGASVQTVVGSGSIEAYNVDMDNSAGVTLDGIVLNIDNNLDFQNGIITTVSGGEVYMRTSNAYSITGANETSEYVNGNLRWNATQTGTNYIWTIGDATEGQFITLNIAFAPIGYTNMLGFFVDGGCTNRDVQCLTDMTMYYYGTGIGTCCEGTWTFTPNGLTTGWSYNWFINTPACSGIYDTYVIDDAVENSLGVEDNCPNTAAHYSHFSSFQHWSIDDLLPVTWLSFEAEKTPQKTTLLTWQTAEELDNSGYNVQHSIDGFTFEEIGFIEGNGTTSDISTYYFEHKFPRNGINYYRLQQVDFNGNWEYSEIRVVQFESEHPEFNWNIFPNPVTNHIIMDIEADRLEQFDLEVYDPSGRLISLARHMSGGRQTIDISSLDKGLYLVRLTNSVGTTFTKRLVKVND